MRKEDLKNWTWDMQKGKILSAVLQAHRPGDVPGDHHGVLFRNDSAPILFQFLYVVLPSFKDVHRFIRAQGKMQVRNCKYGYCNRPF